MNVVNSCVDNEELKPITILSNSTRTEYPLPGKKGYNNKKQSREKTEWSIPPWGCFWMSDVGVNCFCANSVFQFLTWGNSLRYAGINTKGAELSSFLATLNYGNGPEASAIKTAITVFATLQGAKRRAELVDALFVHPPGGETSANALLRCCCAPYFQCQETDTVFAFYRDSLGYKGLHYGNCYTCECTRWYVTKHKIKRSAVKGIYSYEWYGAYEERVRFPWELRGEVAGPNYDKAEVSMTGWDFVDGRPVRRGVAPALQHMIR